MMRRHVALALVWLAFTLRTPAAHAQAGTAAASFLSVGSGASVLAMSGATLASGSDLAAAAWNPASLARVDALQLALAHTPLPGGATQDWLSAGGRLRSGETRWALQALVHHEGDLEARDATNQAVGALAVGDVAFVARLAHPLSETFSVGAGAEYIRESLAGVSGAGLAFEAGVRAQAGPFGAALAARHIGGGMRYDAARYDLPAVIAAGVSWQDAPHGVRLALDVESPSHYYKDVRVGGEWFVRDRVALRAGYRRQVGEPTTESLSGASFGMGTGVGPMWMDYAFTPGGADASGEHRVGLTFRPSLPGRGGSEGGARMRVPSSSPEAPPVSAPARIVVEHAHDDVSAPPKLAPVAPETKPATEVVTPEPIVKPSVPPPVVSKPASAEAAKPAVVAPAKPVVSAPAKPVMRPTSVVVGEGETLASIAQRWGVTVPSLMMANDLVRDHVAPGTRLKLPLAATR